MAAWTLHLNRLVLGLFCTVGISGQQPVNIGIIDDTLTTSNLVEGLKDLSRPLHGSLIPFDMNRVTTGRDTNAEGSANSAEVLVARAEDRQQALRIDHSNRRARHQSPSGICR